MGSPRGGNLGLGVGGEFATEFDACGVPVRQRGAGLDEALEVLRVLSDGTHTTFDGRFTSVTDRKMRPGVRQKPFPRVSIAGCSDAALNRAARAGDAYEVAAGASSRGWTG
jgi:alkanesulfonate monooxygenase SsuD/methylene tetrahydromethanopterin reductase-like flavin-dependent oxidoreductase (luciferase family)